MTYDDLKFTPRMTQNWRKWRNLIKISVKKHDSLVFWWHSKTRNQRRDPLTPGFWINRKIRISINRRSHQILSISWLVTLTLSLINYSLTHNTCDPFWFSCSFDFNSVWKIRTSRMSNKTNCISSKSLPGLLRGPAAKLFDILDKNLVLDFPLPSFFPKA